MHLEMLARLDPGSCASGSGAFYVCQSNDFKGCCLVDPCALPGCPNLFQSSFISISTTAILAAQPSSSSTAQILTPTPSVSVPATVTVFTDRPTTIFTGNPISSTGSTTSTSYTTLSISSTALIVSTTTTPASPTQLPVHSKSRLKYAPLIAGVVIGVVVLLGLLALGFFCFHRRQKLKKSKQLVRYSPSAADDSVVEYDYSRGVNDQPSRSGGMLDAAGGRHTATQTEPAELGHPETQRGENRAETNGTYRSYQLPAGEIGYHTALQNIYEARVSHAPSHQSNQASFLFATPSTEQTGTMSPLFNPRFDRRSLVTSPIPGIMEMEADVPSSYVSPGYNTHYTLLRADSVGNKEDIYLNPAERVDTYELGMAVYPAAPRSPASVQLPTLPSTFVPASTSAWSRSPNSSPNSPQSPSELPSPPASIKSGKNEVQGE